MGSMLSRSSPAVAMGGTLTVKDVNILFEEWIKCTKRICGRDRGSTSTAANFLDSSNQTGSLGVWYGHLTRRQIPLRETCNWRDCDFYCLRASGFFCGRRSQQCRKWRDGYHRVCRRNGSNGAITAMVTT